MSDQDKKMKDVVEFYNESLGATVFGGAIDYEAEGARILAALTEGNKKDDQDLNDELRPDGGLHVDGQQLRTTIKRMNNTKSMSFQDKVDKLVELYGIGPEEAKKYLGK